MSQIILHIMAIAALLGGLEHLLGGIIGILLALTIERRSDAPAEAS